MKKEPIARFPLLLVSFELITYLSNDMYLPALPQIVAELHTSHYLTQLSLTTWFAGAGSLQFLLGPLSDRYGRRPILLLSVCLFLFSTIGCALASTINALLVARFLQGCSVCAIGVAGYAAIHELYDSKRAIQIISLMSSIAILAASFGPSVGGLVLLFFHWRFTFWILVIWALIILVALFRGMPESNPSNRRAKFNTRTLLSNYQSILLNQSFMKYTAIYCIILCGTIIWISMGPFLIIETFHHTPLVFGLLQILVFGCFVIGSRFIHTQVERLDTRRLIDCSLLLLLAGAILSLMFAALAPHFLFGTIMGMMIYEVGAGMAMGALHRTAVDACQEPMGVRMAVFSSWVSISCIVGSLIAGLAYDGRLAVLACCLTLLAALAYGVMRFIVDDPP